MKNLEKKLGYEFKNKDLLKEALTHKSFKKTYNNERLEFLGDAVMDLIIGDYLFHKFEKNPEGDLSKLRASLVNEKSFKKLALSLDLGSFILISSAEENNNGREKSSLLSNAFEALIGAIYLESGLEYAREVALRILLKIYPKIDLQSIFKDYKTTLQELTQAEFGIIPEYKTIRSFGPDHKKDFEIALFIQGREISKALGKSKKEAQQEAAKIALEILKEKK